MGWLPQLDHLPRNWFCFFWRADSIQLRCCQRLWWSRDRHRRPKILIQGRSETLTRTLTFSPASARASEARWAQLFGGWTIRVVYVLGRLWWAPHPTATSTWLAFWYLTWSSRDEGVLRRVRSLTESVSDFAGRSYSSHCFCLCFGSHSWAAEKGRVDPIRSWLKAANFCCLKVSSFAPW